MNILVISHKVDNDGYASAAIVDMYYRENYENLNIEHMPWNYGMNIPDLDEIYANYGADTARLFILSDSPPARDFDWTDAGVEGCYKFISRVYRLYSKFQEKIKLDYSFDIKNLSKKDDDFVRQIHIAIKKITHDIENEFQFNTVISSYRELTNAIYDYIKDECWKP